MHRLINRTRVQLLPLRTLQTITTTTPTPVMRRYYTVIASTNLKQNPNQTTSSSPPATNKENTAQQQPKKKTMAELDEELRLKMEGMSGDGGSAGVEYEDGKAEGLKRGVKANMFRLI